MKMLSVDPKLGICNYCPHIWYLEILIGLINSLTDYLRILGGKRQKDLSDGV